MPVNRRTAIGIGGMAAVLGVAPESASADAAANAELATRFVNQVLYNADLGALDDMVAEDYEPSRDDEAPGREAFKERMMEDWRRLLRIIPDLSYTIDSVAATDERVLFRGLMWGHTNEAFIQAVYFREFLIVDGKIKTAWELRDEQELMRAM